MTVQSEPGWEKLKDDIERPVVINTQVGAGYLPTMTKTQCRDIVSALQNDKLLEKNRENGEKPECVNNQSQPLTSFTNNCSTGSVIWVSAPVVIRATTRAVPK